MRISAPAPQLSSTQSSPRVVHGLAYGLIVSVLMWVAIAVAIYELV